MCCHAPTLSAPTADSPCWSGSDVEPARPHGTTPVKLFLAEQLPRVFVLSCKPLSDFGFQPRRPLWIGIVCDVSQFHSQSNGILANGLVVSVTSVLSSVRVSRTTASITSLLIPAAARSLAVMPQSSITSCSHPAATCLGLVNLAATRPGCSIYGTRSCPFGTGARCRDRLRCCDLRVGFVISHF
jgi:hypothetical protein